MESNIYIIIDPQPYDYDYVKIGFSNEPERRLTELSVGANPCFLIAIYEGKTRTYIKDLEKKLHNMFRICKHRNEWFKMDKDQLITVDEYIVNFCDVRPHYYNKEYLVKTQQDSRIYATINK